MKKLLLLIVVIISSTFLSTAQTGQMKFVKEAGKSLIGENDNKKTIIFQDGDSISTMSMVQSQVVCRQFVGLACCTKPEKPGIFYIDGRFDALTEMDIANLGTTKHGDDYKYAIVPLNDQEILSFLNQADIKDLVKDELILDPNSLTAASFENEYPVISGYALKDGKFQKIRTYFKNGAKFHSFVILSKKELEKNIAAVN